MGTGFDMELSSEQVGIIPRAMKHLFEGIDRRRADARIKGEPAPEFKVTAQFLELYNEEIYDLLDSSQASLYRRVRRKPIDFEIVPAQPACKSETSSRERDRTTGSTKTQWAESTSPA